MLSIQNNTVSETLLITVYMKYLASRERNPIIRDESALALVPQIDYDFSRFDRARASIAGTAIRVRYFDGLTADFIRRTEKPVIVALGCGLDDRLGRVGSAAADVPFVQLDLPDVISLRREWLPPGPNETLLAASAFESGWADTLVSQFPDARFLFVIEGVLMYFPRDTVRGLFETLTRFGGSEAVFDVCSSFAVKNSDRHDTVSKTGARFEYGCDDDREMEKWSDRLKLVSVRRYSDFPEFRRVGLPYWAMRLIPAMGKAFRMLHYRIN